MARHIRLLFIGAALLLGGCDRNTLSESEPSAASAESPGAERNEAPSAAKAPFHASVDFVGSDTCAACHRAEYDHWQGSHHDLAMQEATPANVLGDFDNSTFEYFDTTSRFHQKDGHYRVRTDGPDGKLHDYPIAYTFGVQPLQQYLIELPGGKLQALSLAWDSREESAGGQRWFHLYPERKITHQNPLHWTGPDQNWNFMCADCHSTNLQKNYDPDSRTFSTTWSEINVGCEACHGPGSGHVQWTQNPVSASAAPTNTDKGFQISYTARKQSAWEMNAETGTAQLRQAADNQLEIETCAQCHSRRLTHFPGARPGDRFLDHFSLALLSEDLYHADGQIDEEVFVYGSFLQSKMHAAGVTCSNCHEPHSLELRVQGNGICAQCHMPTKFDTAEHHFHPVGSEGAQCVSCHMPATTYMQVDPRRDHSFRVPRPDLSDRLQTPNACIGCHSDESNTWAAQHLEEKFGKPAEAHYGEALYAGRHGLPGAEVALMALITDERQPEIARATAVGLLPRYLSRQSAQLLQVIAQGDSPLLNLALAQSLESISPQVRPALAIPLLYEDRRVTASLAARSIVGSSMDTYPQQVRRRFARALEDYLASQTFNADRPESLVNLADTYAQRGEIARAEDLFLEAIALAPDYSPAYINLSDIYRATNREEEAESLLRTALESAADRAAIQHALGLSLVRQKKHAEALDFLRQSAESPDTNSRYIYVYAIALNSSGESQRAIAVLENALARFPQDREILRALIALNRDIGDGAQAERYQQRLGSL